MSALPAAWAAKILLVDDLESNLHALGALLRGSGVELHTALSGPEALELLLRHEFALAIIDVQMPGMNGFELASLMRGTARTRNIPIIFITAGAQNQQHRFEGYEAGAVDFLFKPIEPDILRYKTAVFLELDRSRQELARQRDELRRSEQRLHAELEAARRLQELSTRLIQADQLDTLYQEILETTQALTSADFVSLHLAERPGGGLRQYLHRGFREGTAEAWAWIGPESAAPCAAAARSGQRVIVPDVEQWAPMAGSPELEACGRTGLRAAQCSPLISRVGELLGTISTGWRVPRQPGESELRTIDVVARQAADLLERTRTMAAERESAERTRFMAESMPQMVATARPDGGVDYMNRRWMEFTGLDLAQLRESGWLEAIHPEDRDENQERWLAAVATGDSFTMEHRVRRADGVYRWHLTRAQPMRDESGRITMWIGSTTEIHEQKETEADLRRLNEDLSQFTFAASHDLQEPLRMISSFSQLFLESYRGEFDEKATLYLQYIKDGTQRMRDLLVDLLSYTEVSQRGPQPGARADLNRVLELVSANLRVAIAESGAEIQAGPLPSVVGEEAHFVQLFQNLLSNAIKYRSEAPPRITITAAREGRRYRFAVSDNGIGIEPEYHQQIFGVFKRLHGRSIPGTGIGLSICQRVVERYQGRIWVESTPGQGTTFQFILPAPEADHHAG